MDGESAPFVFDPDARIRTKIARELQSCPAKRLADGEGQRGGGAAFPSVQSEIADAPDADMVEKFRATAPADHDQSDARMARQALQDAARPRCETHLIGARCDGHQRAVKIKKNNDMSLGANFRD